MSTALANPTPAAGAVGWFDLAGHRQHLVRYAERRLLDPALAEDLVHDVFEAVMSGRAVFAGRSALRSWLVGILKHKIVDLIRERALLHSLDGGDDDEAPLAALESPDAGPHQLAEQRQLLARTLERIAALPEPLRRVVELRVLHDADTETVCQRLEISAENLFVRLHRARRQLAS